MMGRKAESAAFQTVDVSAIHCLDFVVSPVFMLAVFLKVGSFRYLYCAAICLSLLPLKERGVPMPYKVSV